MYVRYHIFTLLIICTMIDTYSLSRDFGGGKGVFGLSLNIREGEVFGFLGPNGAGKTTTIRMLLGFISPDSGKCMINGLPSFSRREEIMQSLGYLPSEISFFEDMKGTDFLNFIGGLHKMHSTARRDELLEYFDIDPGVSLRKMSKGMKQKIAIVAAFMHSPRILILDEPTSGLDPLMQRKFNDLIIHEKQKGTTVFMSSHNFEEVERTCDRIGIIRKGHLIAVEDIGVLHRKSMRRFTVTLTEEKDVDSLLQECGCGLIYRNGRIITVSVGNGINEFIRSLGRFSLEDIRSESLSLEELFMQYYSH